MGGIRSNVLECEENEEARAKDIFIKQDTVAGFGSSLVECQSSETAVEEYNVDVDVRQYADGGNYVDWETRSGK